MPNIFLKVKAWQLSWLTRAIKSPESSWVCVVDEIMRKANLIDTIRVSLINAINSYSVFLSFTEIFCALYTI